MVLDFLGKKLSSIFTKLTKSLTIDKKLVKETLDEIKRTLIQADVNLELVNSLIEKIKKRFYEEKTPPGFTKREHFLKILYEELVNLLGKEFKPFEIKKKPFIILMVGLLGSGKTTTTIKLAKYFQKQGYKVGVICADVYRPAALEQLQQLGKEANVAIFGKKGEKDVFKIVSEGISRFTKKDIILIDTAGRHKEEKSLMKEIKKLYELIKPDEVILVIDASIGQVAKAQAEAFGKVCPIGSIIISKLDGTAKGGGALSACAATGAKVRFIGTGEKIEDLEPYDAKRFVSRILGLGDLETLLEKAKEVGMEEKAKKIVETEFTLNDFIEQIEAIRQMGPLTKLIQMIPGLGFKLPEEMVEMQEQKFKKYRIIVQSMTPEERLNPEIINDSRIRRIARGSGTKEEEVRELLSHYKKLKKVMKKLKGLRERDLGKLMKMLKGFSFKL